MATTIRERKIRRFAGGHEIMSESNEQNMQGQGEEVMNVGDVEKVNSGISSIPSFKSLKEAVSNTANSDDESSDETEESVEDNTVEDEEYNGEYDPEGEGEMDDDEEEVEGPYASSEYSSPLFTLINVEDGGMPFAGEWSPSMDTPTYIGETEMLLQYLHRMERKHKVTMPIKACGIDPIVFENVETLEEMQAISKFKVFQIPLPESSESESNPVYEIIEVDGSLYLSCISECLDKGYLNSIMAEATAAIKSVETYVFEMVGFRKLSMGDESKPASLINTLRLNTFEMSTLVSYMNQVPNINVSYQNIENKQCICFTVK